MNAADFPRAGIAEAIARLEGMAAFLDAAIAGASAAELRRASAPGEFSLLEQACHLRDLEREGYLVRVRRILAEERPALASFDGAAVAGERDYLSQDAQAAVRAFDAARRDSIALLAPLTAEDLAREATFEDRAICLADLLGMMVEHDRGHREEVEALLRTRAVG